MSAVELRASSVEEPDPRTIVVDTNVLMHLWEDGPNCREFLSDYLVHYLAIVDAVEREIDLLSQDGSEENANPTAVALWDTFVRSDQFGTPSVPGYFERERAKDIRSEMQDWEVEEGKEPKTNWGECVSLVIAQNDRLPFATDDAGARRAANESVNLRAGGPPVPTFASSELPFVWIANGGAPEIARAAYSEIQQRIPGLAEYTLDEMIAFSIANRARYGNCMRIADEHRGDYARSFTTAAPELVAEEAVPALVSVPSPQPANVPAIQPPVVITADAAKPPAGDLPQVANWHYLLSPNGVPRAKSGLTTYQLASLEAAMIYLVNKRGGELETPTRRVPVKHFPLEIDGELGAELFVAKHSASHGLVAGIAIPIGNTLAVVQSVPIYDLEYAAVNKAALTHPKLQKLLRDVEKQLTETRDRQLSTETLYPLDMVRAERRYSSRALRTAPVHRSFADEEVPPVLGDPLPAGRFEALDTRGYPAAALSSSDIRTTINVRPDRNLDSFVATLASQRGLTPNAMQRLLLRLGLEEFIASNPRQRPAQSREIQRGPGRYQLFLDKSTAAAFEQANRMVCGLQGRNPRSENDRVASSMIALGLNRVKADPSLLQRTDTPHELFTHFGSTAKLPPQVVAEPPDSEVTSHRRRVRGGAGTLTGPPAPAEPETALPPVSASSPAAEAPVAPPATVPDETRPTAEPVVAELADVPVAAPTVPDSVRGFRLLLGELMTGTSPERTSELARLAAPQLDAYTAAAAAALKRRDLKSVSAINAQMREVREASEAATAELTGLGAEIAVAIGNVADVLAEIEIEFGDGQELTP